MNRIFQTDWMLVLSALFLLGTGLLSLYSLSSLGKIFDWSESVFVRQASFAVAGFLVMGFFAMLDYRHIAKFSTLIFFAAAGALVWVLVFGTPIRGTAGWLSLGPVNFQPVEAAKVALIIFLASFISKKRSELGEWVRITASLVLVSLYVFLVLRQPDLGSALVITGIWAGMTLASGIRVRHAAALILGGVAIAATGWFFLEDYQHDRITAFLDPASDPQGSGYNVIQSMVAVGSGGLFGKGVGFGSQSQLAFLPERHTDFLFAVIAEELGTVGVGLTLFAYGVLLYRIWRIGALARDNLGYLIALGAFLFFLIQIVVNVGMNIGLLPVTGIPAPFLSYGGSSLLVSFALLGILISVSKRGVAPRHVRDPLPLDETSIMRLE